MISKAKKNHAAVQAAHGKQMAALLDEEEQLTAAIKRLTATNAVNKEELNDLQFIQMQEESQLQQSPIIDKAKAPGKRAQKNSLSTLALLQSQG